MARTGDPNSATSQFFINVGDNKRLDFKSADPQGYGYTVFGKVIAGMDVVDKIAKGATGAGGRFPTDVPVERVVIKSARVVHRNNRLEDRMVVLHTNHGDVTLELDSENSPATRQRTSCNTFATAITTTRCSIA